MLKKFVLFLTPLLIILTASLMLASKALSAETSSIRFTFGDDIGSGTDGLGPGEFEIPLRCNLDYWSWSYGGPRFRSDHSKYSVDINRFNITDESGDPVLASADGKVVDKYPPKGQVTIKHEGDYYTLYVHMQNILVSEGQRVSLGQKIGEIGDVGAPGQNHLHVNHSKGGWNESDRIQVCYKRYGCNPASVAVNDRERTGTNYNKGCS